MSYHLFVNIRDCKCNLNKVELQNFLTESRLRLHKIHQKIQISAVFIQEKTLRVVAVSYLLIICLLLDLLNSKRA